MDYVVDHMYGVYDMQRGRIVEQPRSVERWDAEEHYPHLARQRATMPEPARHLDMTRWRTVDRPDAIDRFYSAAALELVKPEALLARTIEWHKVLVGVCDEYGRQNLTTFWAWMVSDLNLVML